MTAKVTPESKQKPREKVEKSKEKKKKKGRYKLQLKGWLKTPADWAKFDAWAKLNAQPRKIPEPEPIIRTSKPLWKMKKRIDVLAKPLPKPDLNKMFRLDLSVSKKALKAKASKRIKEIAKPVLKPIVQPQFFPAKIKKATLAYQATQNIIDISKPKDYRTEECKIVAKDLEKLEREMVKMTDKAREKEKRRLWAVTKKALACPDLLSSRQIRELITDAGVYRTALVYEFTPWMQFLSLPAYRVLKNRKDDTAIKWREEILNEMETRGKRALEERTEKKEKRRIQQEKVAVDEKNKMQEKMANEKVEEENKAQDSEKIDNTDERPEEPEVDEGREDNREEQDEDEEEGEEMEQGEQQSEETEEKTAAEEPKDAAEDKQNEEKAKETPDEKPKKVRKKRAKAPTPVDEDLAKKRRMEKHAWRFEPPPWKEGDPLAVKPSALKAPESPRMAELAKPHIHKDTITCKNPFAVKKSALTSAVPARMTELAKPARPRSPVERRKPREKNKYGKPIFPMPPYGKKLPPRKPYKERECKTDEKTPGEPEVKEKKEEPINPIAFKPTIDPYFDPEGAELQLKARNALKEKEEVKAE